MILTIISKIINRVFAIIKNSQLRESCLAEKSAKFYPSARIENISKKKDNIIIGKNSLIKGELLIFAHCGRIEIGDYCFIGEYTKIWSSESIKIGDRVLISHNVNIHDTNSHPIDLLERHEHFKNIIFKGHPISGIFLNEKKITICDDVWIGFNSIILKGITLGKGSIVAAGSVVVNDVEPFTIVAGNPAKLIRKIK